MKTYQRGVVLFLAVAALGACATVPTGPSVMVLPPEGKPFDQFRAEDECAGNGHGSRSG